MKTIVDCGLKKSHFCVLYINMHKNEMPESAMKVIDNFAITTLTNISDQLLTSKLNEPIDIESLNPININFIDNYDLTQKV